MGIDGLLRQLKEATTQTHLNEYRGQTVVVDAFSWLHKACYGCAMELATGKATDAYVKYMLRKVDLLRSCGIHDVILVFDGDRLPLKASTHTKRSDSKSENRALGFQRMADAHKLPHGTAAREDHIASAYCHFQKAVSITPQIVTNVMIALRTANIRFVVAPFEADAQMVWMCKAGLASAIITEDSDVLVYCLAANVDTHVLLKLEDNGAVQVLSQQMLHAKTATTPNSFLQKIHFLTTGEKDATRMFVQFCALAGCDFLDSLPNMGIVTALKHIFSFRGAPSALRVQRLLSKLKATGTKIPSTFYTQFQKAESVFFHHVVFNMETKNCEFLIDESHANCHLDVFTRVKESLGIRGDSSSLSTDLHSITLLQMPQATRSYLGEIPDRTLMVAMFHGQICSRTKRPLVFDPPKSSTTASSSSSSTIQVDPDCDDDEQEENHQDAEEDLLSTTTTTTTMQQRVVAVDPAVARRRQVQREQQRGASMRSLLDSYTSHSASGRRKRDDQDEMNQELQDHVVAPPTTVFSMKDLAQRHARQTNSSSTTTTTGSTTGSQSSGLVSSPFFSKPSMAQGSTEKKKRKLLISSSTPSPSSSSTASTKTNTSTLFQFFQKK